MLWTKPTLVLVLRIGKDLDDATLGGLLGGLLGWPSWVAFEAFTTLLEMCDDGDDEDFDCNVREGKTMRASSFLRTCFNNAIWEQHIYKVASHLLVASFNARY